MRFTLAKTIVTAAALALSFSSFAYGPAAPAEGDKPAGRQYTFSWQFQEGATMAPRGGTTTGANITIDDEPSSAWQALRKEGLSKQERDRRAILAMAGPYRTSFDFIETVGFTADYSPARPYQSWGTEYVYVVADEPDFVSLQHILVMTMLDEDGFELEPIVVKHWRQDWNFEASDLHTFRGHRVWAREQRASAEVEGRWMQSVYQVDDTPRYQAVGTWEHFANYSSWSSEETWRPLPRREFSVRDDYHVLVGTNKHTVTPTGWVQEESNLKVVLDDEGRRIGALAREAGLARYERIEGYDWTAGDAYWERTAPFWAVVRDTWSDIFEREDSFRLEKRAEGSELFMVMFILADTATEKDFDPLLARGKIEEELAPFLFDD
ncbi:MAG: DUF6607 family protein [Pseudomonadota bacterium]